MMTTREVSNSDDVIDSRDVIARIDELVDEREAFRDIADDSDADPADREAARVKLEEWEAENDAELGALLALEEQCKGYTDWEDGATLIRDSYFEDYAEELADDIGAIDRNATWPLNCIDWEQAARELQQDYTQVDFDGVDYWVRIA